MSGIFKISGSQQGRNSFIANMNFMFVSAYNSIEMQLFPDASNASPLSCRHCVVSECDYLTEQKTVYRICHLFYLL